MLRRFIVLFVLIGFGFTSQAQDSPIRFGVKLGTNYGWLKPNISELEKDGVMPRLGLAYGIMFDYQFSSSSNYFFSSGIQATHVGGRLIEPAYVNVDDTPFFGKRERTYRMQYLTIPLTLKMRTNQIGYFNYFASFGVDAKINLSARANDEYEWLGNSNLQPQDEENIDIKDDIRALNAGLNIQLGTEYNISGNTNLYVALGWHNGFLNVLKGKVWNPQNDGFPEQSINGDGKLVPVLGPDRKAITNYISLDVGIFF